MKQESITLSGLTLEGVACRTCNEWEMNPPTAKIGQTVARYFEERVDQKIQNRKNPGKTYCAYTAYESDHTGMYTYFIGEEVSSKSEDPQGLSLLQIPPQKYVVFTNGPGPMPQVCIEIWQHVWTITPKDFGSERSYVTDFELYQGPVLGKDLSIATLYIGVKE